MAEEVKYDIKELLAKVQCKELDKLAKLYPGLDFTQELEENPRAADFLVDLIKDKAMAVTDPLQNKDAPKLDDDFSNYFVINNMPVCKEEAKVDKLKALVIKAMDKSDLKVSADDIDMPFDPETNQTYGTAFIKMANEEQARLGARVFDNF